MDEKEIFAELEKDELSEEVIQDNTYPFEYAAKNYRVVMPTQLQLSKAKRIKHRYFTQLVSEGTPLQKNWVKTLKETQDIDIEKLQEELFRYQKDYAQLKISEAKTKDSEEKTRAKVQAEQQEVLNKLKEVSAEISKCLEPAAEPQAKEEYLRYLTAECTEVLIDEKENKWERVWKSWDDYQKDQTTFAIIALIKLCELIDF